MYSDATRSALLEEATALFAERGYSRTSLEDVASASQVTRGAVYHHFAGKLALFEAVLEEQETRAIAQIAETAAGETDSWRAGLLALDAFLDRCCDPVYGRLVWQEGPAALGWVQWKEYEKKYAYGLVEGFVAAMMEAGYLERKALDTTTQFCFSMLGAAGLTLANTAEADKPRVRDECADLIRRMFTGLRGAAPNAQ
jgi:AcrR family transcriptional regulator